MSGSFWRHLDALVQSAQLVIDRPKGSAHPRYEAAQYPIDYGYLDGTTGGDGREIDVWRGSLAEGRLDGVVCTVDLLKRDLEVKVLLGCRAEEKAAVLAFHNESEHTGAVLLHRDELRRNGRKMINRGGDRMSDISFRLMSATFKVVDRLFPSVDKRVKTFGIQPGMTVVDYGCGPGRYTTRFARLVGESGLVYAVDVHELALEAVRVKMDKERLRNIVPTQAQGYDSGLPDDVADMVFALDMFFAVREPTRLLQELRRIVRSDGVLIIDDGHQSRQTTLRKIGASGCWEVKQETEDHLRCRPT
jgi:2-polyprenyl-3-methyl-5-hydroxy-6-metoxy-1,4-benzoquinol methylase